MAPGHGGNAATVISIHRTSQGVVRYRGWPGGWISVELLNGTVDVLAWVPGQPGAEPSDAHARRAPR